MSRTSTLAAIALAVLLSDAATPDLRPRDDGYRIAEAGLSPSAMAGAEIWYKATAGSERFTTYVFQQRMGILIDWYKVLRADRQAERFKAWGLIHDPGCCVPGAAGCPARSPEETYGFEWCPGDGELLAHVGNAGRTGYRDPACDFQDPQGRGDRQDPCDLHFGTSTGALGFRKFPNPRFDAARWRRLNGGRLATWEGFAKDHLADFSVEPPFLIGLACGACHIAFDPLHPPRDPANPRWENVKGAVGNQYTRVSEIFASGMAKNSPEWQLFAHERPGTVDTSAIPNDQVHNPGTMNAIINFARRPVFPGEQVRKWRPVAGCPPGAAGADIDACWCEPGKPGKCWQRSLKTETVKHILKGGEDSIGAAEAIQRVYFNIGSCSEECWVNHLTDLRQLDPTQRNYGQTPFDIGQCRRDCPSFRAIEDRLPLLVDFFLSRRPTDLYRARGLPDRRALEEQLDQEFGAGAVARGRAIFARRCAHCHSSQPEPLAGKDFLATDPRTGDRIDWLGSDAAIPVTVVGTDRCRALHSNHMAGHVWEQYASETYRARPAVAGQRAREAGGGRGYYRAISLINVWAFAPLLHNNAVGPEVCGAPGDPTADFYRSPYVKILGSLSYQRLSREEAPPCWPYDPSVEGRYALFKASIDQLLNPEKRIPKVTLLDDDIRIELGPRVLGGHAIRHLALTIPAGRPVGLLVSFQHKLFAADLVLATTDYPALEAKMVKDYGEEMGRRSAQLLKRLAGEVLRNLGDPYKVVEKDAADLLELYATCTADVKNGGHRFGESLAPADKKALTAFLATL